MAALRAFCWRPRACPPFLAAAVRFADDDFELDEGALEERLLPDDERPLPDDDRLRALADERLRLDADRLPDPLFDDPLFALLLDDRVPDERLEPLDFFLPPEPPLLRRSAICAPP